MATAIPTDEQVNKATEVACKWLIVKAKLKKLEKEEETLKKQLADIPIWDMECRDGKTNLLQTTEGAVQLVAGRSSTVKSKKAEKMLDALIESLKGEGEIIIEKGTPGFKAIISTNAFVEQV